MCFLRKIILFLLVGAVSKGFALSPRGINVGNNSEYAPLANFYDFVSEDRSTLSNNHLPADISLLLGNSHIETFIRYALQWRSQPKRPAIIIAGGIGRGTPGLIAKVREFYSENESFQSLNQDIEKLSEAEIIAQVLIIEGVDPEAIRYLDKKSTNTAENFVNSLGLLEKLAEDLGKETPHLEIITHAPLVYRVHLTALKKLSSLKDKKWPISSRSYVESSFDDLTYNEKVAILGYSLGFPLSCKPEENINRLSEVERIDAYGNQKTLKGEEADIVAVDWQEQFFNPGEVKKLREELFAKFMQKGVEESKRENALSLAVYLQSGDLVKAEKILRDILKHDKLVDYSILTRIVAELFFAPHLFSSKYFMQKYNMNKEYLKNYYKIIKGNVFFNHFFQRYSPHANYFMIVNREISNPLINEIAYGEFAFPRKMELHVGHRCHANCKFCYSYKLRQELAAKTGKKVQSQPMYIDELKGEIPLGFEDYKEIIKTFKENSVDERPILVISGGAEPATFPRLADLIEYAASMGINVELYTSGVGLLRGNNKEELMKKLLKCSFIRFSLNAATPETYFKQMDLKGFEHVKDTIRQLTAMKEKINSFASLRANFVINKDNYPEIIPFVDMCHELGLDQAVLRTPYTGTTENLSLAEQRSVELSLSQLIKNRDASIYGEMQLQLPGNFVMEGYHPRDFGVEQFDWRTAFFSPTITPYGNIVPRCTVANPGYYSDQYSIGSVAKDKGGNLFKALYDFYKKKESFTDNIDLFDSSTLSQELFLRFLDRERKEGFSIEELPFAAVKNYETRFFLRKQIKLLGLKNESGWSV